MVVSCAAVGVRRASRGRGEEVEEEKGGQEEEDKEGEGESLDGRVLDTFPAI